MAKQYKAKLHSLVEVIDNITSHGFEIGEQVTCIKTNDPIAYIFQSNTGLKFKMVGKEYKVIRVSKSKFPKLEESRKNID